MHFHPPASIPQVSFGATTTASSRSITKGPSVDYIRSSSSTRGRPSISHEASDISRRSDILCLRVHLRDMLKRNRMFRAPAGFPFSTSQTAPRNNSNLKHASRLHDAQPAVDVRTPYEFKETLELPDAKRTSVTATISYQPPATSPSRMMSWKIHAQLRDAMVSDTLNGRITLAQVEIDPIILETAYGAQIMTNPRIILQALALSVELAVLITVSIATTKTGHLHAIHSGQTESIHWGDILFVATHPNGHTEIAYAFNS